MLSNAKYNSILNHFLHKQYSLIQVVTITIEYYNMVLLLQIKRDNKRSNRDCSLDDGVAKPCMAKTRSLNAKTEHRDESLEDQNTHSCSVFFLFVVRIFFGTFRFTVLFFPTSERVQRQLEHQCMRDQPCALQQV